MGTAPRGSTLASRSALVAAEECSPGRDATASKKLRAAEARVWATSQSGWTARVSGADDAAG
jgi:hypothetical protein